MKFYKDKNPFEFVRFGVMKPVKQKGYSNNPDWFHEPPAPKGFYAMPKIAQEFFLVSALYKTQPQFFDKERRKSGGISKDKLREIRHTFKKTKGLVWSHMGKHIKHHLIMDAHGDWVLTDMKTWSKAFNKNISNFRFSWKNPENTNWGHCSKDVYEVFFEKI